MPALVVAALLAASGAPAARAAGAGLARGGRCGARATRCTPTSRRAGSSCAATAAAWPHHRGNRRPGSETPTGRFAVTDKLSGPRFGPYYGCCILALNGKQPNLPAGWQGGNRLAIHGTNSPGTIGAAASAGCLRAGDADLRLLMRRVPLGTPVFIRS